MKIGQSFNPMGQFVGSFIPNCIQRLTSINSNDKMVWARLAQHAGQNGECFPSQVLLAEELGTSERTINSSIRHLEEQGFIKIVRPNGKERNMHHNNSYVFLWHSCFDTAKVTRKSCGNVPAKVAALYKENNNKENNKETKKHSNGKNPIGGLVDSLKSKSFEKRKPHVLFNKIINNPISRTEAIASTFFANFESRRNKIHQFVVDDQMEKGLALVEEHLTDLDDNQIHNVLDQHFNKKIFHQQGRDFNWNLFVSNLHKYVSERFR